MSRITLRTLTPQQTAQAQALAAQFPSLRELMSDRAYAMGLRNFTDCVKQEHMGSVARALRGDGRKVPVEWLERYVEATGDTSPILYLAGKHLDPDAVVDSALADAMQALLKVVRAI